MIDNYDSFVYNLVRYFCELDEEIEVVRNDKITIDEIKNLTPEGIIISPGPKSPYDCGISTEVVDKLKGEIPMLGICLGYQCIAHSFGGKIIRGKEPTHGKISSITHDEKGIFQSIKNKIKVTRYHSLVVDPSVIPDCLEVTSRSEDGVIMGLRHKEYPIEGVQFHPEAELTECGHDLLKNFIKMCK